jgi:N-acetylglutamate synthase-like GNAT family acetyltransferase
MPNFEFFRATPQQHRAELIDLNIEYVSWVLGEMEAYFGVSAASILGMSAQEYVPLVIDKLFGEHKNQAVFYLVTVENQLVGMGGMRFLCEGVAELKRLYVRPQGRGHKLGEKILDRLLMDARQLAYQQIYLDSAPFMTAAHRLYESRGFVDRAAYDGVEAPEAFHHCWRFMSARLTHHM